MKLSMKHLLTGRTFVKLHLLAGSMLLPVSAFSQQPVVTLEKVWVSDTSLRVPESVYFDAAKNILYVSNIEGKSNGNDGNGFISRMTPEGKILDLRWVEGMSAPKGMGIYKGRLYVADLTEVVVIDIRKGAVAERIPVEGAVFLNDLTIDNKGVIYVSDTRAGRVHQIKDGKVNTLFEVNGPNGLLWLPSGLQVLADGAFFQLQAGNTLKKIADIGQSVDGIVQVKAGEFIVSCWPGEVFYVNAASGAAVKLLDTREQQLNTADIGYNPKKKMVYIPTFNGNTVAAYRIKGL
ncbi:ATP/GTP-binding protein [uncultured Chitinophaga sp.]|jgi:Gluconolactonase|uniref:SMP-30/gluconolactonase/LRE family protein n=1 Tax=uncultured Chitinophaga sp. TaxID=339340 RepID=UPI002620D8F9|nr:ATP/GTP-binding protein [uncultured Chitinophaga sp.]